MQRMPEKQWRYSNSGSPFREGSRMSKCVSLTIGPYCIGGPIGLHPTAILGTIFFEGQDLLLDPDKGDFDVEKARGQIEASIRSAGEVAVSLLLDVVADTEEAISKELDFVINEFEVPFVIDSSDEDVRMYGLEIASRLSALDRAVYNSIGADSSEEEFKMIQNIHPAAVVVSAIDASDYGVESALGTINSIRDRLPQELEHKVLLDIGFLDEVSVKISCKIAQELRKKTGLPVGGAPCNGLHMWKTLKAREEETFLSVLASTLGYCTAFGLDFLFVGPLRHIKHIAWAQAASDIYNRYYLMEKDRSQAGDQEHPIHKMF